MSEQPPDWAYCSPEELEARGMQAPRCWRCGGLGYFLVDTDDPQTLTRYSCHCVKDSPLAQGNEGEGG